MPTGCKDEDGDRDHHDGGDDDDDLRYRVRRMKTPSAAPASKAAAGSISAGERLGFQGPGLTVGLAADQA